MKNKDKNNEIVWSSTSRSREWTTLDSLQEIPVTSTPMTSSAVGLVGDRKNFGHQKNVGRVRRSAGASAFLVVVLCLLVICLFDVHYGWTDVRADSSLCQTMLEVPSRINVAVLVWADSDELVLSRPITSYAPIPTNSSGFRGIGPLLLQPFYLGVDFYISLLAKRGYRIPVVRNGNHDITVNISYINMGRVDWNVLDPATGFPVAAVSSIGAASAPGGLFDRLIQNASSLLGQNETFTFYVPNPMLSTLALGLVNRLEDRRLGITVHPYLSPNEAFVCDGQPTATSLTPDCRSPVYGRDRRQGARRFETLFGVLPDLTNDAASTLNLYHTLGVHRVAILRDADAAGRSYSSGTADRAAIYAEELNMEVVMRIALTVPPTGYCPTGRNCPSSGIPASQRQVWPKNHTALEVAEQLRTINPDAVLIVGASGSAGAWSIARLIEGMQELDWAPKAMSWIGAFETGSVLPFLKNGNADLLHTTSQIIWHPALRGAAYRPQSTETNLELIESNTTHAAPQIFTDKFNARYGPKCDPDQCVAPASASIGRSHPFWKTLDSNPIAPMTYSAMLRIQKLIEVSASDDVSTLLAGAPKISTPSVFHTLQVNRHGQTSPFDNVVSQYKSASLQTDILTPFNIGKPTVYPMPSWSERVFRPQWFADPLEKVMIALNAICIFVTCILFGVVIRWSHLPIIRATTVSFVYILTIGALLMLVSNFLHTFHTNDVACAAQAWCLTLGYTLVFSSIFIKNFRIWWIFRRNRKLSVTRIHDRDLMLVVAGFILFDVLLNSIWMGAAGMRATLVVVDPLRPSLNYVACDYSSSVTTGIVWVHVATKGALLFCGAILTYAIWNVQAAFNETTSLSICIYNAVFVSLCAIPIVASGLGGRKTTILVRTFAVMFLAVSTQAVFYVHKLIRASGSVNEAAAEQTRYASHPDTDNTNNSSGKVKRTGSKGKKPVVTTSIIAANTPANTPGTVAMNMSKHHTTNSASPAVIGAARPSPPHHSVGNSRVLFTHTNTNHVGHVAQTPSANNLLSVRHGRLENMELSHDGQNNEGDSIPRPPSGGAERQHSTDTISDSPLTLHTPQESPN